MYDMELQEKEMPTPMTIEMENEMNKDEIEAALNKLEEPLWLNGGRSVPLIIRELLGVKHYETIRSALQSPRVPVIEGLDEAMSVINKFIRARDAEIDFLPEKSTKNTSEWISHFMHNVNYTLSFNDWMSLDKVHAYAELSKT